MILILIKHSVVQTHQIHILRFIRSDREQEEIHQQLHHGQRSIQVMSYLDQLTHGNASQIIHELHCLMFAARFNIECSFKTFPIRKQSLCNSDNKHEVMFKVWHRPPMKQPKLIGQGKTTFKQVVQSRISCNI